MTIRSCVIIPLDFCPYAEFVSFSIDAHSGEEVAILFPGWKNQAAPLVRLHSECLTGEVFGSQRCDCKAQLNEAMEEMGKQGGILLYLRQEGRGIGLYNKLDAYKLQIEGMDTFEANLHLGFPADARDYKVAATMLKDLNIQNIKLMTNNPDKARELVKHGIEIEEVIPTGLYANKENMNYLEVKRLHGHSL